MRRTSSQMLLSRLQPVIKKKIIQSSTGSISYGQIKVAFVFFYYHELSFCATFIESLSMTKNESPSQVLGNYIYEMQL